VSRLEIGGKKGVVFGSVRGDQGNLKGSGTGLEEGDESKKKTRQGNREGGKPQAAKPRPYNLK